MNPRPRGIAPRAVLLSADERQELERRAAGRTVALQAVVRARVLLALADDPSPSAAARRVRVDVKTVRRWRERFLAVGLAGLDDRVRPGRPPRIPAEVRYEVISLACACWRRPEAA